MQLRLMVNNTSDLEGSAQSTAIFGLSGGSIGSSEQADWVLTDRQGSVLPHHMQVRYLDGHFCLHVYPGARVYVNGSATAVEADEAFQVADGDEIKVGIFTLSVYIILESADKAQQSHQTEAWARRFAPVDHLVGGEAHREVSAQSLFETQLMQQEGLSLHDRLNQAEHSDPIAMMEARSASRTTHEKDPIAVFERGQKAEAGFMTSKVGEVLNIEPEEAHYVELPDDSQPGSSYVAMPTARSFGEAAGSEAGPGAPPPIREHQPSNLNGAVKRPINHEDMDGYLEMLAQAARTPDRVASASMSVAGGEGAAYGNDWHRVADAGQRDSYLGEITESEILADGDGGQALIDHVVLRPLCAALGLNITQMSQPQVNRLASDIGSALKAAIHGLMVAHRREMSEKSHLAETHLHAIEDNPLRLDTSVEEAIKDMFLVQSPVHLSAQAAITESLELLLHHRAASDIATEAALDAILQALSPLALARRFMKYKGHAPRAGDLDAWHWNMYRHYYAEMRSHQQGGLSRMFWEVHRQIYDREMRSRTQAVEDHQEQV